MLPPVDIPILAVFGVRWTEATDYYGSGLLTSVHKQGRALDMEGTTATSHKHLLRWLGEEAHARGKSMHVVPHFALFDRWDDTLSPAEINAQGDVVWPWLYNRFRTASYGEALLAMGAYWRGKGMTVPVYPIFDHGRTSYSGIAPAVAAQVPKLLREAGVATICLFQPHVSYRGKDTEPAFALLWNGLQEFARGGGEEQR